MQQILDLYYITFRSTKNKCWSMRYFQFFNKSIIFHTDFIYLLFFRSGYIPIFTNLYFNCIYIICIHNILMKFVESKSYTT